MTEEVICSVCKKLPKTKTCDRCGIELCDECAIKSTLVTSDIADRQSGFGIMSGVNLASLRPGQKKEFLCKTCYQDLDVTESSEVEDAQDEAADGKDLLDVIGAEVASDADEKLLQQRIPDDKRFVTINGVKIDIGVLCPDPRDAIDDIRKCIEDDWVEQRYTEWDTHLHPFAEASDLVRKDRYALEAYPPLYINPQYDCNDCSMGSCNLKDKKGKCGLESDAYQARLSLRHVCEGAQAQMMEARELLDYAVKVFGREKAVSFGNRHELWDWALDIGMMTGKYANTVGVLERVMGWAEAQLNKISLATHSGTGDSFGYEAMTFHAGWALFVAQEVSELLKVACFDVPNCADHDMLELRDWPEVNILGGLGNVDRSKPVIAFVGDNFLPAWNTVNYLKEKAVAGKVEICGLGSVGLDMIRFYDKTRMIASGRSAERAIRMGFADVLVASTGCANFDIMDAAKKAGSKLIWVGTQPIGFDWWKDQTEDPMATIVDDLINKVDAVWCRDIEKVGEIAVRTAAKIKGARKNWEDYQISEADAKAEAGKCRQNCMACFNACPYGLTVGDALKSVGQDGLDVMAQVEKGCVLCRKCEDVCPENIRITDIMLKLSGKWAYEEAFTMRPGRGTIPYDEVARSAWTTGNSPGFCRLLACGGSKQMSEDVAWIANELATANGIITVAGCGGMELAKHFDDKKGKFIYEDHPGEYVPGNIIYTGSCSSHCLLTEAACHWARIGPHISHFANFIEVIDVVNRQMRQPMVLWGDAPDRMYAIAAAYARAGETVIVGPVSGFEWERVFMSNQYDLDNWFIYDTSNGRKVAIEPLFEHLIIPVETIEEALAMFWNNLMGPSDPSLFRIMRLDPYFTYHQRMFGELPDNWNLVIKTNQDLPIKLRAKLLKKLGAECGWETDHRTIFKAKHRDGRMLAPEEFSHEYGIAEARFWTRTPDLLSKQGKKKINEDLKQALIARGYKL